MNHLSVVKRVIVQAPQPLSCPINSSFFFYYNLLNSKLKFNFISVLARQLDFWEILAFTSDNSHLLQQIGLNHNIKNTCSLSAFLLEVCFLSNLSAMADEISSLKRVKKHSLKHMRRHILALILLHEIHLSENSVLNCAIVWSMSVFNSQPMWQNINKQW